MRMCLSIAITEMVTPLNHTPMELIDDTCPGNGDKVPLKNETVITRKLFDWDESTQVISKTSSAIIPF